MANSPEVRRPSGTLKRRLRAAFSADIANFSGNVSVSETRAFGNLSGVLKIGREELANFEGVLIGIPGDGLFALFESVVNAVLCAITIQERLAADALLGSAMLLRIGIHLGDVLFEGDLAFGETLNIAARLQALADPGGTLVSGAVVDAVSARVAANFEPRGAPQLKNIPRRIATYAVHPRVDVQTVVEASDFEQLEHTMQLPTRMMLADAADQPNSVVTQATDDAIGAPSPPPSSSQSPVPTSGHSASVSTAAAPEAPERHLSRRVTSGMEAPPTPEAIAIFGDAIAVHLGPVGRLIATRKAKNCSSLNDLLAALETDIPTSTEQLAFRSRIKRQFGA